MHASFWGGGRHKVDAKGRVSIPAEFRPVLRDGDPDCGPDQNPRMVLNFGPHLVGFLECYTMEAAQDVNRRIQRLPRGSRARQKLQYAFNTNSRVFVVDDTGRIVLSQELQRKIGLREHALFVSNGDTFRIWDADAYEANFAAPFDAELAEEGEDVLALLPGDDE